MSFITGRRAGRTIWRSSAWKTCSTPAAAAGASIMTKHSAPASAYTTSELLAVMASRLLTDGQIVFAGIGVPLLAATLAQRNFAPQLTILFEGGTIGPFIVPGELPPSTNEQRCTRRSNMVLPITDVLLLFAARLCRHRLHGRGADRPLRQSQLLVHRRRRQSEDPPARHGRRQRHLFAHQHDRGHEARKAPLRRRCRFRHLAGLARRADARARKPACRKAACGASSPTSPSWASTRTRAR